jgi:hypothetical protein
MASATLLPFLLVPVPLIIIALVVYWQLKRAAQMRELMKRIAPRLGLQFLEGQQLISAVQQRGGTPITAPVMFLIKALSPWRMEGQRMGMTVSIFPERRGSGKNSTTYTIVRAEFSEPVPGTIHVYPEGAFERFSKNFLGSQDIQTGDERFDSAFMIGASDPAGAKAFLTPDRREKLLRALAVGPIVMTEKFVQFEKAGVITDEQKLRSILEAVAAAAL